MRKLISVVLCLAVLFSTLSGLTVFAQTQDVSNETSYSNETFLDVFKKDATLAWNDEFEGDKVDETKWEIAKGWGRVDETWGTEEDGNVTVSDGCLKLRAYEKATSEFTNGKEKTKLIQSGEVSSKASWQHGLIEIRAKLPKGKGVYPAIWTMGRDYQNNTCLWPWSGEIDIMEAVGTANNDKANCSTWQTLHTSRPFTTPGKNSGGAHIATGLGEYKTQYDVPLNNDFHNFWLYLDGSIMIVGVDEYMMSIKDLSDPNLACFKDWEQWLILGLQMGGLASSPERTDYSVWEMLIDYVRVYRFEDKEDYSKYQIFEAENLEHNGNVTTNYMPCAQKCVVNPTSSDITLYLDDINAGNYDVMIDYVGINKNAVFDTYINGVKTSRIDAKQEYNAQMKYTCIGSVTLEEDSGFQMNFDYISGTNLYIDKVFLIKRETKGDVVINKENAITTSRYIEVSSATELESAFASIESGGTIKLVSDVTMANTITTNIDCTLDLNDHTLSTGALDKAFRMPTQVTVTVKNGKVVTPGKSGTLTSFFSLEELKMKHYLNVENVDFTISAKTVKSFFGEYYANGTFIIKDCTFDFSSSTNSGTTSLALASVPNVTGASFADFSLVSSTVIGNDYNTAFEIGNCSYGSSNIKLYDSTFKNLKSLYNAPKGTNGKEKVQIFGSCFENLGSLTSENLLSLVLVDSNSTVQDLNGNSTSISVDSTSFKTICNHSYSVATCTAPSTCEYCKKSSGKSIVGHKSDGGVVTREANCYYSEITTYSCTECGEVLEEKETAPIKGHEYKSELLGENTCTTMRYYKYSCENCDYYYMDGADTDISGAYTYKGHVVDESTKVEFSSCVNHVGYYYTCAECGKENCKYIEHIGTHDIYSTDFTAPTETTTGSVTYKCNDCDYSKSKTIKAGEHIVTVDGVKYFTVDGAYYTPYQYSSEFLYYVDQNGKEYGSDELIMLESDLTLSKVTLTEHIHIATQGKDVIVPPTCEKQGYTEHLCSICKNTYTDTFTQKLPHNEIVDKGYAPTCTEKGLTDGKHCGTCSQVLVEQIELDPLGHKEVVTIKGVAPTCTLSGILDEIICETCGVKLQERAFAPAKGHEYKELVTKEPTCGKAGVKTYKCECGHSYTESIPKTNAHSYKWVVTKKATYFAKGTKSYKCSCGKIAKTATIKKLVLKKPTVKYTSGKKKIAIKYTKVTGAKGFQVRYRLTTSKKWKTVYFKTTKSATKYIKSLIKNKKYYLQTRAYVQSGSKKAYSSWTTRKTIKVK